MTLTLAPRHQSRTSTTENPPQDALRSWLAGLTAETVLSSFATATIRHTPDLTAAEIEAACRAVACPDLFIIHAPDHVVRERVIAAIAGSRHAGHALVLSPNSIAADRIAERLAKMGDIGVVRALADDENPTRPSPLVAKLTSGAIEAEQAERLKREAAAAVASADARLTTLEKLTDLAEQIARFDSQTAELATQRASIEAIVRAETDTAFAGKLVAIKIVHEGTVANLSAESKAAENARKEKESSLASLRQQHAAAIAENTKKPGFLARLFGGGKRGPDPAEFEKQIRNAEADITAITARIASIRAEIDADGAAVAAEHEKATLEEIASRQFEIDARVATVTAERDQLRTRIEFLGANLDTPIPALDELAAERYAATHALVEAKERATQVNQSARELARRYLTEIPVVIGTPGSIHADPAFERDHSHGTPAFNLLILDCAEELTERDFLNLAKLADRWLLIGDVAPVEEPKPYLNGSHGSHSRHSPGRNGRPVDVPFTSKLAQLVDRETWVVEAERLVCRLLPATPEQRRNFTREPLLDRPEIELRFTADANNDAALAEVAFPAGTSISAAKSFLFHELGEVLLRPCGSVTWEQTPNAIVARWPDADRGSEGISIELDAGVCERVIGNGSTAFTASVAFDLASGWTPENAAEWLASHLRAECLSRFAVVPRTGHAAPRIPTA